MTASPDIAGLIKDSVTLNLCLDHHKAPANAWGDNESDVSMDEAETEEEEEEEVETDMFGAPIPAAFREVIKQVKEAGRLDTKTAEQRAAQFLMMARGVQKLRLHGGWQARGREFSSPQGLYYADTKTKLGIRHAWHSRSLHDSKSSRCLGDFRSADARPGWSVFLIDALRCYVKPCSLRLSSSVSIVYIDLELILLGVPTLRTVHLESGISSGDRRDQVSEIDHQARLTGFKIETITGGGIIGVQQLCWLVRLLS